MSLIADFSFRLFSQLNGGEPPAASQACLCAYCFASLRKNACGGFAVESACDACTLRVCASCTTRVAIGDDVSALLCADCAEVVAHSTGARKKLAADVRRRASVVAEASVAAAKRKSCDTEEDGSPGAPSDQQSSRMRMVHVSDIRPWVEPQMVHTSDIYGIEAIDDAPEPVHTRVRGSDARDETEEDDDDDDEDVVTASTRPPSNFFILSRTRGRTARDSGAEPAANFGIPAQNLAIDSSAQMSEIDSVFAGRAPVRTTRIYSRRRRIGALANQ